MGNSDTKLNFRKAVVELTTKTQPVEAGDEAFWSQFWSDSVTCVQDVFTLIPAAEIRALREESPSNLATLCYKAVEKLVAAGESGCSTMREQQTVLNCVRLLTRILPYIFEDPDWRGFFWSTLPGHEEAAENDSQPLAQSLLNALSDLLFCPEFTVATGRKSGPDTHEDMQSVDSCEYIWEAGVGFAHTPPSSTTFDANRCEILKLLLTCFSETMYLPPVADAHQSPNQWIAYFTSTENRHALPLFTSLLNIVCAYDPVGYGVPYNHLMFADAREPMVEAALQVLCVTLDNDPNAPAVQEQRESTSGMDEAGEVGGSDNLFVNYLSRIHREEDFYFILKGLTRLLNNPLVQTYLPGSCKKIQFHQELFVMFWKMCDINKKFMFYVLKSSDVLDILVPILYHLNDARADQSRVGLMHIGVFILLLLSGERNFGVRLNKPYTVRVPMDIPVFTGTHADFLIIVFHKIITTGHQRLQPLFDCLLTIVVNVSPYLKTLSMVASTKLLHLLEAFSTPWFLYASPTNHHLVFFLLEVFNNVIQYQFDGNANLIYTIIRKRNVFHQLANLATDHSAIAKALTKRGRNKILHPIQENSELPSMEGSIPASEAEPGTLKATLAATPALPYQTVTYAEDISIVGEGAFEHDYELLFASDKPTDDPWESVLAKAFNKAAYEHRLRRHNALVDSFSLVVPAAKLQRRSSLPEFEVLWEGKLKGRWSPTPSEPPKLTISELSQLEVDSRSELKDRVAHLLGIEKMTEKSPASMAHNEQQTLEPLASPTGAESIQPGQDDPDPDQLPEAHASAIGVSTPQQLNLPGLVVAASPGVAVLASPIGEATTNGEGDATKPKLVKAQSLTTPPGSPTDSTQSDSSFARPPMRKAMSVASSGGGAWVPSPEWVQSWKQKLPLQTIMRLLQVLVPQVEKICIDKGLTDESEILKFLQHGTLVGLLPVPHPILIRKYQANSGTTMWFRTYMWGVIYLRNVDPPVWYDTDVKLFEIQRV